MRLCVLDSFCEGVVRGSLGNWKGIFGGKGASAFGLDGILWRIAYPPRIVFMHRFRDIM